VGEGLIPCTEKKPLGERKKSVGYKEDGLFALAVLA
jgi:hypothetical protein